MNLNPKHYVGLDDAKTPEDIARRIDFTLNFLDTTYPGWAEHIDIDQLKMVSIDRCIIGQLMGKGVIQDSSITTELRKHGIQDYDAALGYHIVWDALAQYDDRWKDIIRKRRGEL